MSIPPMLERNVDNLYLLDEPAGPDCLDLFNLLLEYNACVERVAFRVMAMNAQQLREEVGHLHRRLEVISAEASEAAAAVRPPHDAARA